MREISTGKVSIVDVKGKNTYIAIELFGRMIDCVIEDPFSIEIIGKDNSEN